MGDLRQKLVDVTGCLFMLAGVSDDATEPDRPIDHLKSMLSDIDKLFDKLAQEGSAKTYADYTSQYRDLRNQHIRTMRSELRLRRQASTPKPDKPLTRPSASPRCEECSIKQNNIDKLNVKIESYQINEADFLMRQGKHIEAADIYSNLLAIRESELQRRRQQHGDRAAVATVEGALLTIKGALSVALGKQNKLSEAESMIRFVSQQRTARGEIGEAQSAQRQLCAVLRLRGSAEKIEEAEDMYRKVWRQRHRQNSGDGYLWVLENGHNLSLMLAEQNRMEDAITTLQEVLNLGLSDDKTALRSRQLVLWLAEQGKTEEADHVLQEHVLRGKAPLSSETLVYAATVAQAISKKGDDSRALPIWRQIWDYTHKKYKSHPSEAFSSGWKVSLALFNQGKYDEAKEILHKLLIARAGESEDSSKTLQINALLAWTYRKALKPNVCKTNEHAMRVWRHVQDKNILGFSYSTGSNLVWASYQDKDDNDRKKAREVWQSMLEDKKKGKTKNSYSKTDRKAITTCWEELAEHVAADAEGRGFKSSKLAKDIRAAMAAL